MDPSFLQMLMSIAGSSDIGDQLRNRFAAQSGVAPQQLPSAPGELGKGGQMAMGAVQAGVPELATSLAGSAIPGLGAGLGTLASYHQQGKIADYMKKLYGSMPGMEGLDNPYVKPGGAEKAETAIGGADTKSGAMGGAVKGASIGTAIAPGIGTAIGALGGAVAGGLAGRSAKKEAEKRQEEMQKKMEENAAIIGNRAKQRAGAKQAAGATAAGPPPGMLQGIPLLLQLAQRRMQPQLQPGQPPNMIDPTQPQY